MGERFFKNKNKTKQQQKSSIDHAKEINCYTHTLELEIWRLFLDSRCCSGAWGISVFSDPVHKCEMRGSLVFIWNWDISCWFWPENLVCFFSRVRTPPNRSMFTLLSPFVDGSVASYYCGLYRVVFVGSDS